MPRPLHPAQQAQVDPGHDLARQDLVSLRRGEQRLGPRVEAEFTYRRNSLDTLEVENDGGLGTALGFGDLSNTTVSSGGTIWSMSGMLNGWFDFHVTPSWVPYVGGGAGVTASISVGT